MFVSTRGRYALRVLIDIAENSNGNFIPMKDVAARQDISLKYLEQILPILTKNGIIEATSGKGGGYRLKGEPENIHVSDVLRLTEGDLSPVACLGADAKSCAREKQCRTLGLWSGLNKVVNDYLDNYTIADMTVSK